MGGAEQPWTPGEINEDGIRIDRTYWPWSEVRSIRGRYVSPPDLIKSLRGRRDVRRVLVEFSATTGTFRGGVLLTDEPLGETRFRALMRRLEEFLALHHPNVEVQHDPLEPSGGG